jgi:hypothetical protein
MCPLQTSKREMPTPSFSIYGSMQEEGKTTYTASRKTMGGSRSTTKMRKSYTTISRQSREEDNLIAMTNWAELNFPSPDLHSLGELFTEEEVK